MIAAVAGVSERDPDAIAAARAGRLRAAGRFADARIVEVKRAIQRAAEKSRVSRDVEVQQAWWDKYRGRIRRFVCSRRWEDDLYSIGRNGGKTVLHGRDIQLDITKDRQRDVEYQHCRSELYPPGGAATLMLRCCHGHWVPPQAMIRPLLCDRCLAARGAGDAPSEPPPALFPPKNCKLGRRCRRCKTLTNGPAFSGMCWTCATEPRKTICRGALPADIPDGACLIRPPTRTYYRPDQIAFEVIPWRGVKRERVSARDESQRHHKRSNDGNGRCHSCGLARMGRPVPVAAVAICLECESNVMSAGQVAHAASAHRCDRKVRDRDMPAHFGSGGYGKKNRRFCRDDPRTIGWFPGVQIVPAQGGGEGHLAETAVDGH